MKRNLTGSRPNGYGLPLNIRSVVMVGSGFKVNMLTCSKVKLCLKLKDIHKSCLTGS